MTSIGASAFYGCSGLTHIALPAGVTSFGFGVFQNCSRLVSITLPAGVESVSERMFLECSSLTSVTLPEGVRSIGSCAFYGCGSLTSITLPASLKSIEESAFYGCGSLAGITLPAGVTDIDDRAFAACPGLCKAAFDVTDINAQIAFGDRVFVSVYPTVYCHVFTAPDRFFSDLERYTVVYFEYIDIDTIRAISLPGDFRMACGDTYRLPYPLFPADGTPVAWTSSDPTVLSADDGTLTALAPGTAVVTAAVGDLSGSMTVETYIPATGILLNETEMSVRVKDSVQLSVAALIPENAGERITWTSSDTAAATVDGTGLVTTKKTGDVTVTAVTERGVSASCLLHVVETLDPAAEIRLNETEIWVQAKESVQLSVAEWIPEDTGESVTWTSSDTDLATVDGNGLVKTIKPGDVTVTAVTEQGAGASCLLHLCWPVTSLSMEPASARIPANGTLRLTATAVTNGGTFTNRLVTFTSSDETILTVDAGGLVTAIQPGAATVTAASYSGRTAAAQITVGPECPGHVPVTVAAVEPACTETGLTEGCRCALCGEVLIAQETVPALGHDIVIDEAVPASCIQPGKTAGSHCERCGIVLAAQTDTPALGHDWDEAAYIWTDDPDSVTASHTCLRDGSHRESETVGIRAEVTVPPTESSPGQAVYTTLPFTCEGFTAQSRTAAIPALSDMRTLRLPADLAQIGEEAFAGLAVNAVIVPEGCAYIESRAFADCPDLRYIRVSSSAQIAPDAFEGCGPVAVDRTE